MLTPNDFRTAFPEFTDPMCYPDGQITFWAGLGEKLHNQCRWGNLLDYGIQLFIAHNLAMDFNNKKASKLKQAPGQITGAVTSGSVDKVSYSRDVSSVMNDGAGHWNLTTYGLRWRQLSQMVGAGPVQLPMGEPSNSTGSIAWPGVIPPIWG